MGVWVDITDRKIAEQALRDAMDRLRQTQEAAIKQERMRALGQMASGIAHDFNNSLAAILGFAELMLLKPERF